MTTQEAIAIQKWLHNNHFLFNSTFEKVQASTDMAIRSLEAWEKVREEINEAYDELKANDYCIANGISICRRIINKHLKEVENADSD